MDSSRRLPRPDGLLYWPTLRSVAMFDPGRQVRNSRPPLIGIENLYGDGREYRPWVGAAFRRGQKRLPIR